MGKRYIYARQRQKGPEIPEWVERALKKYAEQYERPIEEMRKVYLKLREIGYSPIDAVEQIPKSLWSGAYERYLKGSSGEVEETSERLKALGWEPLAIGPEFKFIEDGFFVVERPHATDPRSIGRLMKAVERGEADYSQYALVYDEKEYMYKLVRMDKW